MIRRLLRCCDSQQVVVFYTAARAPSESACNYFFLFKFNFTVMQRYYDFLLRNNAILKNNLFGLCENAWFPCQSEADYTSAQMDSPCIKCVLEE